MVELSKVSEDDISNAYMVNDRLDKIVLNYEYWTSVESDAGRFCFIFVEKMGGGTVGEEYSGEWDWIIYDHNMARMASAHSPNYGFIYTGTAKTHQTVASMVLDFYLSGQGF